MDRNLLVNELQSLVTETKRKYPDVKEAAERALLVLKTTDGTAFTPDARQVLLSPVLGGCKTKVAKIVAISIGALQRLVSLQTVGGAAVPALLQTLLLAINQGVEIQLRIIQTLLLMMTYCPDIHQDVLGELLALYFKLQDSKTSVVSSTASASLRQAVVMVFERVHDERPSDVSQGIALTLPDGNKAELNRNEWDAYYLFDDLCTLTNRSVNQSSKVKIEGPRLLKISSITATFGLELIESILSGFANGFRSQTELISLLRTKLSPLLESILIERAAFPVMLRAVRVVFLLLRYFYEQIPTQAKIFWRMLIRGACNEANLSVGHDRADRKIPSAAPPLWLRAMLLEVLKALCRDTSLLHAVWQTFDADGDGTSSIYGDLVSAIRQIISEKPGELGINETMQGLGISHLAVDHSGRQGGYLDMGLNAVSSAATAGVSTVSAMIGTEGEGRLDATCGVKVQCIEQHDKIDPNPIPERYPYLLALDMLVEITDGLAVNLYTDQGLPSSKTTIKDGHPVVDLSETLPDDGSPSPTKPMLAIAWPALLASLSFVITTNISNELFDRVLKTIKTLIAVSDGSGLITCRDAFLNTLSRFAVPAAVVKASQVYTEMPATPGLTGSEGFKAAPSSTSSSKAPALSERNLSCLTALIEVVQERGDTLNMAWHDILETIHNANFVLGKQAGSKRVVRSMQDGLSGSPRFSTSSTRPNTIAPQPSQALLEAEPSSVQGSVCLLMTTTSRLSDSSYYYLVSALCRLSGETIGLDKSQEGDGQDDVKTPVSPSKRPSAMEGALRRRTSGLSVSQTIRQGEKSFALMMLDVTASTNVERIMTQSPQTAWDIIITHVIDIAQYAPTSAVIRMQAAEVLGNILGLATTSLEILDAVQQSVAQSRIFEALIRQVRPPSNGQQNATDLEIRTRGLTTLSAILESSGHTIASVWPSVFRIVDSVFESTQAVLASGSSQASKAQTNLIRTAYPSLNLACSDYLSTFDAKIAQHCLDSLCNFAGQHFDMNIALSSIGSIWNLMDAFQSGLIDISSSDQDRLWLRSLNGMLRLTASRRSEVRASAVQTMFRSLETHGAHLSNETWEAVTTGVLLPLLSGMLPSRDASSDTDNETDQLDEERDQAEDIDNSHALALKSVGTIYETYTAQISAGSDFEVMVEKVAAVTTRACAHGGPKTCSAALQLCQKLVKAYVANLKETRFVSIIWSALEGVRDNLEQDQLATMAGRYSLTQDNLLEYMRLIGVVIDATGENIGESQTEFLLRASRSAVTYTRSPTYPLDVDAPSPLQQSGLDLLARPELDGRCSIGSVISVLAEYITLAFVGGFDYVDTSMPGAKRSITKKVSYVGLAKASMALTSTYLKERSRLLAAAVKDGAIERLIGALSLPIKLRLDCPSANKFGKDPALWRTATLAFVEVIKQTIPLLESTSSDLMGEKWDSLWQQIAATFRSILLVDDSYMSEMNWEEAEQEELYDIPAIDLLESSVMPLSGHSNVDNVILEQLADTIYQASILYTPYNGITSQKDETDLGRETSVAPLPREGLRYRCLGLLFSSAGKDSDDSIAEDRQRRTAAAVLPLLLSRCKFVLTGYLASASLRGSYPFERVREEELAYVLQRLLDLELWPGSLNAMQASAPETQTNVIGEALRQSSRAHLFHLYPILLEFIASPLRLPVVSVRDTDVLWQSMITARDTASNVTDGSKRNVIELDVRKLARACLDVLGKEMGL